MRPEKNRAPGRLAPTLLAIAALAVAHPTETVRAQGRAQAQALPLQPGNSWTYDGTIWWVPHNTRRVLEERVTLEMEVLEVVEWGRMRGAVLRGFPPDLVTPAPDRFEGEFTLIQIGSSVHLLRGESAREAIRRLRERDESVIELARNSEVVLDLPLAPGKTFCSREDDSRRARVCWLVEEEDPLEVLPVHGVRVTRDRERYILDLRSGAEHEVRGFVPGVGFTSFAIGHFGDPSALELKLVKVDLAPPPGIFLKTLDLTGETGIEMASASRSPGPGGRRPVGGPPTAALVPSVAARVGDAASAGADAATAPPTVPETKPVGAPEAESPPEVAPAPAPPPDADGDGVPDAVDRCARSAPGEIVDRRGCPVPPPERVVERRKATEAPAIRVALEEMPVPDYAQPACVDDREWFLGGKPIEYDGRSFDPIGTPEPISLDNLVAIGEYDGVPIYVGRYAGQPHMDVWLPVCRTPDTYRLYADLGSSD